MYKAFNQNLVCNNFQYEVGKTYTCEEAKLCNYGFHACENPNDVLDYYQDRFCIVELENLTDERDKDSKRCGTKITIVKELTLKEYIDECFEYNKKLKLEVQSSGDYRHVQSSGDYGHAQSSGGYGHAQSSGVGGHAQSSGYGGHAQSSGHSGHAQSSGYGGHAQSSGGYGHAQSSGDGGHAQSSGHSGHAQSSGYGGHAQSSGSGGHAQSSGDSGHAQSSGKNSIACSLGISGTALVSKESKNLILVEYDVNYNIVNIKIGTVGINIEKDKKYTLKNNEFVEVI